MHSLKKYISSTAACRFWRLLDHTRRIQFVMLCLLAILASLAEICAITLVLPFLTAVTAPETLSKTRFGFLIQKYPALSDTTFVILATTTLLIFAVVIACSLRICLVWASLRLNTSITIGFGSLMYRNIIYQPYSLHASVNSSEVIDDLSRKLAAVTNAFVSPLLNIIPSCFLLVAILATLVLIDPTIALTSFLVFATTYISIFRLSRKQLEKNSVLASKCSVQRMKTIQESLGAIRDIILDGSHDMYIQEYVESDRNLKRIEQKTQMICQYPGYIVEACTISLFVLLACVIALRPDGITQAIPTLGGIVFGAKRLVPPLQLIYGNWTMLASQRDATFKALDILERCSEPVARQLPKEPIPFDRSIDFVDTAFRYRPETELVLCGVNLSIPRGTRLGIKGPTGSGKSTLIDILMGLLTPTSGVIEVDGVTIDESNIRRWQTRIAHVPQAIYLADITIAENIAIGIPQSEIDMARVRDCARKARIDDYIDSLNEGYKTYVGERGVRLSGGQRQRIGIARALYKQADVIVLDEATSALDNDTEAAVMDAIDSLDRGLTLIIVAHRLSTLEKCDRIIEIRNGRAQSTLSPV